MSGHSDILGKVERREGGYLPEKFQKEPNSFWSRSGRSSLPVDRRHFTCTLVFVLGLLHRLVFRAGYQWQELLDFGYEEASAY